MNNKGVVNIIQFTTQNVCCCCCFGGGGGSGGHGHDDMLYLWEKTPVPTEQEVGWDPSAI